MVPGGWPLPHRHFRGHGAERRLNDATRDPPNQTWPVARPSRYTRNVSCRHRISLVLLMVLTALPVSGSVCAMLCDSAAATRATAHHGSGKPCDDQAPSSSGPQLRGASAHDCSDHDAAMRLAATTTATRADSVAGPSLLALVPAHDSISTLTSSDAMVDYRTPPGSTPPTVSPLVLRV
jgi:hypothetical protein